MVDRILNATLFKTLSWVEAYWLAVAIIGIVVGWVNIVEARTEKLRMQANNIDGIGMTVASTSIRGDAFRVIEMFGCLAVGFFSALTPNLGGVTLTGFYWWSEVVFVVSLLTIEGLIISNILLIRHNRIKVLRMWDEMHHHVEESGNEAD